MSQVAVTEQKPPSPQKLTMLDRLSGFSLKLFGGPASGIAGSMEGLRDDILKSSLRITPVALVSLSLLITTITAIAAAFVTVLGFVLGFIWL